MDSQIYLPKLTFVNKILIAISSAVFILDFILSKTAGFGLTGLVGLSGYNVFSGHIYTIITYPFMSGSIIELILNCLMLWLMGSEFEANWGRKRYLSFIVTTVIGGAVLYLSVVGIFFQGHQVFLYPLTGFAGIVGAMCLAYAVIYPDRLFSFLMIIPIKAKYFCMLLVVISLYQGIASPTGVGAWGQLGAILSAYLFMVAISHRNFKTLSSKMGKMTQLRPVKKSKAKLSIVKDDNENPPKYWH
ncbi:MAG: rhomboid family intramembrane serine protease [Bdellovibrionales bacterium]|nr:rhomboid family intramembrane serine protease [Bdellovibrionales bacterium]